MVGLETTVTCPKCRQSFTYEFVPGGSFSAIRLGSYRYMRCQKCGKWALFNIVRGLPASERKGLGNSSVVGGMALAVMGGALIGLGIERPLIQFEIIGVVVFVLALLMIGSGVMIGRSRASG